MLLLTCACLGVCYCSRKQLIPYLLTEVKPMLGSSTIELGNGASDSPAHLQGAR